ncbi:MAG: VOC family protein [Acidimicrobiales bacterium]
MRGERPGPAAGGVTGFDHVALPMEDAESMVAFYRRLGFDVEDGPHVVQVHLADQMVNFHRPATWRRQEFTLRAPAARPPCGDLCLRWDGGSEALVAWLGEAGVDIVEGPVERQGGRRLPGTSVYVRDPDGNLLEFIAYPDR